MSGMHDCLYSWLHRPFSTTIGTQQKLMFPEEGLTKIYAYITVDIVCKMLFLASQSQDKQKTKSPVTIHPIAPLPQSSERIHHSKLLNNCYPPYHHTHRHRSPPTSSFFDTHIRTHKTHILPQCLGGHM